MGRVRKWTRSDFPRIVELGQKIHDESTYYVVYGFDESKVLAVLDRLEQSPSCESFVWEDSSGVIRGFIIGAVSRPLWFEELSAEDIVFYVEQDARGRGVGVRLLTAYVRWAQSMNAEHIRLTTTSMIDVEATDKVYQRLGFVPIGINYVFGG